MQGFVVNPDYRPDWSTLHDRAAERRERAQRRLAELRAHAPLTAEQSEVRSMMSEANRLCCECLSIYQHRTLNDCLAWLNQYEPPGEKIDLAIQDVSSAAELIHRFTTLKRDRREYQDAVRQCLPLQRRTFLAPFGAAGKIVRLEWTLPGQPRLIEVAGGILDVGRPSIDVIMLVHPGPGRLHVAFQNANSNQRSIIYALEDLIGYFESHREVLFSGHKALRRRRSARVTPTFYVYTPPAPSCREIFDRVSCDLGVVRFQSLGVVPPVIRPDRLPGGRLARPLVDQDRPAPSSRPS